MNIGSAQFILIFVIVALSVLLLVIGWQIVVLILDIKKTIKKLNHVLDEALTGKEIWQSGRLKAIFEILKTKKS
ncbi:hypothetical protein HYS03_02530 [Candidatus Woesebacteria bacterium]|nr:hypothetical protein [Candidatus Woesebacteria bacterium]QQG47763.1 MAG: hypothetical protein HY044_01585 [Candidatus Woesebacteria bacterium]